MAPAPRKKVKRRGAKAKDMQVYISGFLGPQSIEIAVAYWYRGHYIYGPNGNPIQPIMCPTNRAYEVIGLARETAPNYDVRDSTLVNERSVAALEKTMRHEWKEPPSQEEIEAWDREMETRKKDMEAVNLESDQYESAEQGGHREDAGAGALSRVRGPGSTGHGQARVQGQPHRFPAMPTIMEPMGAYGNQSEQNMRVSGGQIHDYPQGWPPRHAESYYNARARFLAASAPGSRHVTPYGSRYPSPAPRSRPDGLLALLAPNSRLGKLLEENGITRRGSPAVGFEPEWMPDASINELVCNLSRAPSCVHENYHSGSNPHESTMFGSMGIDEDGFGAMAESTIVDPHPPYPAYERVTAGPSHNPYHARGLSRIPSWENIGGATSVNAETTVLLDDPFVDEFSDLGEFIVLEKQLHATDRHRRAGSSSANLPAITAASPRRDSYLKASRALNEAVNSRPQAPESGGYIFGTTDPTSHNYGTEGSQTARYTAAAPASNVNAPYEEETYPAENSQAAADRPIRLTKCPIHGEGCDGEYVENDHYTLRSWMNRGFTNDFPTILRGERVMIDWARILREEQQAMAAGRSTL